jgi:DNA-binding transcriptional ArsR family regulator
VKSSAWDPDELAVILSVLASPVRLRLLQSLGVPQPVGSLRIPPSRRDARHAHERAMTRQALQRHLNALSQVGAVQRVPHLVDGRVVEHYAVSPQRVYALTEQIRDLAALDARGDACPDDTMPQPPAVPRPPSGQPHLLLVRGLGEGRWFTLPGPGPWRVGRSDGCEVPLAYDPYVSLENTVLERAPSGGLVARDLPAARNGTSVNFERLEPGGSRGLERGDVLGVGRTLLLLR